MPRTGRPRSSVAIEVECQKCHRKFSVPNWAIKAGRGKFCSRACYESGGEHRKRPSLEVEPELKRCEMCDKEFLTRGLGRPRSTAKFCSINCATNAKYKFGILKGGSEKGRQVDHENSEFFAHLRPIQHPTTLDIAWAAGVYEGEGWCGKGNTQSAAVGQKERELCDRLRDLFGGYVSDCGTYRTGRYEGQHKGYQWVIHGPRARGFLMTIYKFLTKRRQEQIKAVLKG